MKVSQSAVLPSHVLEQSRRIVQLLARLRLARRVKQTIQLCELDCLETRHTVWSKATRVWPSDKCFGTWRRSHPAAR